MADAFEQKINKCIVAWQASEQASQRKMAALPKSLEAANPSFLVLNLGRVPVSSVGAAIEAGGLEEAKTHKGARVTFMVLKALSPGWTSVSPAGSDKENAGKKPAASGRGGAYKPPPEIKDKLNHLLDGEHVLMHSYDLVNLRGVYMRSTRSSDCIAISPGMVLSMMVWGKGFLSVFKEQKGSDFMPFDIGVIQMSTKSMQSTAVESGQILEIKSFTRMDGASLGGARLLGHGILSNSLKECAVQRSRFADGSHIGELSSELTAEGRVLRQSMVKGNLSSTVSLVRAAIEKGQGTFAIGPDDVLRFHPTESLSDLPGAQISITYDANGFGGASKDWVCKLFNVLALAGCMELLVVMDSYKPKNDASAEEDAALSAFARPDIGTLLGLLLKKKPEAAGDLDGMKAVFGSAANFMGVYDAAGVNVVLDTRVMTKRATSAENPPPPKGLTTIVHPASGWERGYSVNFLFEGRLVHCAVVPITGDTGTDGNKHVLSTIAAVKWAADELVDFEEEEEPAADERKKKLEADEGDAAAQQPEKKKKRAAA